jgi:hypothetical protein
MCCSLSSRCAKLRSNGEDPISQRQILPILDTKFEGRVSDVPEQTFCTSGSKDVVLAHASKGRGGPHARFLWVSGCPLLFNACMISCVPCGLVCHCTYAPARPTLANCCNSALSFLQSWHLVLVAKTEEIFSCRVCRISASVGCGGGPLVVALLRIKCLLFHFLPIWVLTAYLYKTWCGAETG